MALPFLADEFNTDPSVIVWITISFLLSSIGIMLTLGTLGDTLGRKKVFLTGFLVFGLGLTLAPLSRTLTTLFFSRAVQGIGQAMIVSNGNALVVESFPANKRGQALGIENAVVGIGLAGGPSLGGFLLDQWGWQSLFYSRIPFMIIFFILGVMFLKSDNTENQSLKFDLWGSVTLFITVSCFLLSITLGRNFGWSSLQTITPAILAPIFFILFVVSESKAKYPVLELSLFKSRLFTSANIANSLQFLSQGAIVILLPFFLFDARNLSTRNAGLILGTLPIVRLVVGPFAGWASDKIESRKITSTGLLIMTIAYLFFRNVDIYTPIALLVTILMIEGIGTSIFGPSNNSSIMGSVPRKSLGTASGMIATVRQVSMATGIAISGTFYSIFQETKYSELLSNGGDSNLSFQIASSHGFQQVLSIMVVTLILALLVSLFRGPDTSELPIRKIK